MGRAPAREAIPLWRELLTGLGGPNVDMDRLRVGAKVKLLLVVPLVWLPTFLAIIAYDGRRFAGDTVVIGTWFCVAALELVVNIAILLLPRTRRGVAIARSLTYVSLATEIAGNMLSTYPLGVLISRAPFYLVIIVAAYRIAYDYRIGLSAAVLSAVAMVGTVLLELSGWVNAHPILLGEKVPYYSMRPHALPTAFGTAAGLMLIFMATNIAMNRVLILHRYITESVLRRYLPPSMVERAARGELSLDGPPERVVVTVMFADMVGFSSMSERLPPEKLADVVNGYLALITERAHSHGATVDKFVGDAVMVVFGAPDHLAEEVQARRCVALAREVQSALRKEISDIAVHTRIGINTGEAIVGNFGTEQRSDFTVIGPTVNIAARLEAAGEAGRILVGPRTAELVRDTYSLTATEPLQLKGIGEPVTAYFVDD